MSTETSTVNDVPELHRRDFTELGDRRYQYRYPSPANINSPRLTEQVCQIGLTVITLTSFFFYIFRPINVSWLIESDLDSVTKGKFKLAYVVLSFEYN